MFLILMKGVGILLEGKGSKWKNENIKKERECRIYEAEIWGKHRRIEVKWQEYGQTQIVLLLENIIYFK